MIQRHLPDLFIVLGLLLTVAGITLFSVPAGIIAAGFVFVLLGALGAFHVFTKAVRGSDGSSR